ncbi:MULTISPECIES: DUF4870 domain-containing protein [Croceibacter]|jgi:hypothetical protein|uniref:tRNA modification GTPase n=1 Tax=Croceibacter atlanticus (strain ATCC BAA-628 / JCM 21780 / CIP 108009 / IAM 15332 / KCTC 12090 / HTCC2559) TaxID=216432 RepID=A3UAN7_CROAH|nr:MULTISPECIES: DUF4870 domain-containing protein [Croceibacter]HAT70587.1 DUF4870 domain-containing protein [Flavobacteriaceae bacterium]EAP86873.1 tRNA modification GTPase [Croceibacter atlanticus HTCC2559]MBG24960.1 DUF4870 domain-containing protein [Croceibacter sp.]MBW4970627.1 DUF4870 domain-containing protein [Croceibacter atlanticus]WSP34438.1 DUF4870 domain-containing protein [Croceibacter atlanticus]|tara:strand:+ start:1969 stop:2307 length:339 start_codon:yes stop_codon:yes gene_type:complete
MREDKSLLVITHLSQLLTYITGIGGLIVPLIIWAFKKDEVFALDQQGKDIVNFQISIIIYSIICIPLILLFGLGILGLIGIGLIALIFPILNAIRVSNGEEVKYPLTIQILK